MLNLCALAAAVLASLLSSGPSPEGPIADVRLELSDASDVRWFDDRHLLVASLRRGIARVEIDKPGSIDWLREWPGSIGPGTSYQHLALSSAGLITADLAFSFRWHDRKSLVGGQSAFFEYISDIDAAGNKVAIAGLHRDDSGELATEHGFLWMGTTEPKVNFSPVMPFRNLQTIVNCAGFDLDSVRFLSDGSLLMVAGAEPGVFLYGPDGRLKRTWPGDAIGLSSGCDMSRDQAGLLATNPEARQQWINRHVVVDEILDLPDGPALAVRSISEGRTQWNLVQLSATKIKRRRLPFDAVSPWAHLSADRRGDRLALLIADRAPGQSKDAAARLIIVPANAV